MVMQYYVLACDMVIPSLYDPAIGPKHLSWPGYVAHYTAHVRPRIKPSGPKGLDLAESEHIIEHM